MWFSTIGRSALLVAGTAAVTGCIGFDDLVEPPSEELMIEFTSVAVGAFHACGLDGLGKAYCWGGNGVAQLGIDDGMDRFEPTPVAQGQEQFRALFLGGQHSCALNTDQELFCWGSNLVGQLGIGSIIEIQANPTRVTGDLPFVFVSAGDGHTCGLTTNRVLYCWGIGEDGRLGNGSTSSTEIWRDPQPVLGNYTFEYVSAGGGHTCAIRVELETYCWGRGGRGQLGTGERVNAVEPTLVLGGLVFVQVDAGGEHTCGVTDLGEAYCWGLNSDGQLGNGATADEATPVPVAGGLTFATLSAGGNHTCGLTTEGEAFCWGRNTHGQVGDGTTMGRNAPVKVLTEVRFASLEAGSGPAETATCGLSRDEVVYCWGYGEIGQVGDGGSTGSLFPVRVANQAVGGTLTP